MKNVRFTFLIVFVSIVLSLKAVGNNPPLISGANCQETKPGTIYLEACAGERLCFTVCTNDLDSADKVTISGSTGIKGANFTITNKGNKLETGVFCWTPSESDASKVPYSFVVTAKDNASPVNGSTERKFSITVKEKPKAIYNAIIISCNEARFTAKNIGNTNINQYMWIVNERIVVHRGGNADTVWHHFKNSGKKPYSLTLFGANGCNAIYEDTLTLE